MERISTALKVMGHNERLRILALLSYGELTVSELVKILGLSQPRVTQYVKSLEDTGLINRFKEGSWVFSRINRLDPTMFTLVTQVLAQLPSDDASLMMDRRRLEDVRAERAQHADRFFDSVAQNTIRMGDEYLPRQDIENAIHKILGTKAAEFMVDLGTGSGRMLELLSGKVLRGAGVDNNAEMLRVARHKLSASGLDHLSVRFGDLTATPFSAGVADLVTLHQVLHYVEEPNDAFRESARILQTGGLLLIIDFAPHAFEEFRQKYAHRRLGFSDAEIKAWAQVQGLDLTSTTTISTEAGKPDVRIWLCQKQ